MLWQQSFQTETPEPVKYVSVISTWCYARLLPKLMILMEYLLIKTNDAPSSVNHINVEKIVWLQ